MIAKTAASGALNLLPEVLAFSTSLALDKQLLREDLAGSLAHLTMLSRQKIIAVEDAAAIREQLIDFWNQNAAGTLQLPPEEDVHMAIEVLLTSKLGTTAGVLHTARSRNDQVALDLRLHVREQCLDILSLLSRLISLLADQAEQGMDLLLPAYTHRQRAQPISLAYLLCGYGAMFARDVEAFAFALNQADILALGVGAIGGTSLPIDRETTQKLLAFRRITRNGLDTVGDRDFALDFSYATTRMLLHVSRLSTDFIDFSSSEFGFVRLDGNIACGSSMMPQKRNPDVFELMRGKSGRSVGNLMGLLATVKGLPAGYNRDLQEDRAALLETGPLARSVLSMMELSLQHVSFVRERCLAAVESDYTQATDLAEALVKKGLPFRTAYQAVGTLVRKCQELMLPLAKVTLDMAREVHTEFDQTVLLAANPAGSVAHKANQGGTGPASVKQQIALLRQDAQTAEALSTSVPRLDTLFLHLKEAAL